MLGMNETEDFRCHVSAVNSERKLCKLIPAIEDPFDALIPICTLLPLMSVNIRTKLLSILDKDL